MLNRWLSKFLPYQALVGGIRHYRATCENVHDPRSFLHYGRNVRIGADVSIAAPERLFLADNVGIDPRCYIQAVGGCHIGCACQIGAETIILTIEHAYNEGQSLPYDQMRLVKPVFIEDYAWIGIRSSIAPGVRIGEGAIIGMGSVVLEDVPPLAIAVGNPAQVFTYRSKEEFESAKNEDKLIDPYQELPLLKVPPITKRKFRNELKELGFDLSSGHEYFRYEKHRPLPERLVPVDGKTVQKPGV